MSYSFQNKPLSSAVTVGEMNQVVNGVERPYKVYTALLTQSGTDAPVATVLENTLGDIVWNYENVGQYRATLSDAFTLNKTYFSITGDSAGDGWVLFTDTSNLPNYFDLVQYNSSGSTVDNMKCQIEVRVYK